MFRFGLPVRTDAMISQVFVEVAEGVFHHRVADGTPGALPTVHEAPSVDRANDP